MISQIIYYPVNQEIFHLYYPYYRDNIRITMKEKYRSVIRQKIIDAQAQALPQLTLRDVWRPLVPNKALAIIGIRRAGKSSFMWQLLAEYVQQGIPREGLLYFSFEDERLSGMQAKDLELVLEEFYQLNPQWRDQKRAVFFLDEIQVIPGWETFARRLLDSENIELYLSGSSARMLSREVATTMRGRALDTTVDPFCFREFLRHQGLEPRDTARLTKALHSQLDAQLLQYLRQGGFPEVQGLDERSRLALLRSYIDVVLLRDVIERHNLSQPQVLRWLVQQLLANAAGSFSINKFHGDLRSRGVAISKDSLYQMLGYLEDAFLVRTLPLATDSVRRQQVNPRKIYPVDTGLMALYDPARKVNLGHALETVVLHALIRAGADIGYFLTPNKYEIDFHARMPSGELWLVQVSLDISDEATLAREIRPFANLSPAEAGARKLLISLYSSSSVDVPDEVEHIPASEWLLGFE